MARKNGMDLLRESHNGVVPLRGPNNITWATALEVVDYPVIITPAYYKRDDSMVAATGTTNTGKDKEFHCVVVDKYDDDNPDVVSVVSGKYGTVETKSVYNELREQLKQLDEKHNLVEVYVTGNGGAQQLIIEMEDMDSVSGIPDDLAMRIRLTTSVDGTKSHTISMSVHNKSGDASIALHGSEHKLAARHTQTINDRTIEFIPSIKNMIASWNSTIVPMMKLMFDEKFDMSAAVELVDEITKDAGIGERHRTAIKDLYRSDRVRTKDDSNSLYRITTAIGQYIDDELDKKRDTQDKFKEGLSRSLRRRVKKASKKG